MRLDEYVSKNQNISRSRAQSLIKNGLVFLDGEVCLKAAKDIKHEQKIEIKQHFDYVSRGAYKLLSAIDQFGLQFEDKVVLDMGSSTGGFTQVALLNGARKVYAVDVGKGQLDKTLECDKRVVNLENTDIRTVTCKLCPDVDIIIGDLSFISLEKVLPQIQKNFGLLPCVVLFKPQFECGKEIAKKCGGVVKDKKLHILLLNNFVEYLKNNGFQISGITHSQITGGDGNIEYLIYLNGGSEIMPNNEKTVENAFTTLK